MNINICPLQKKTQRLSQKLNMFCKSFWILTKVPFLIFLTECISKIFFSEAKLQVGRPKFHHISNLDISIKVSKSLLQTDFISLQSGSFFYCIMCMCLWLNSCGTGFILLSKWATLSCIHEDNCKQTKPNQRPTSISPQQPLCSFFIPLLGIDYSFLYLGKHFAFRIQLDFVFWHTLWKGKDTEF